MTRRLGLGGLMLAAAAPLAAQGRVVIVTGLGGEGQYRDLFHSWASTLQDAAWAAGVPRDRVVYLGERPARDPDRIAGPATKERLAAVLREARAAGPDEPPLLLVLLGHGADRGEPRLSLPGPDLTAVELDAMLDSLGGRRIVVVNAASASGGFVPVLARPGRVVVTATKSGFEQNHAIFGGYFAGAFGEVAADLDKDERVSVLEAFLYARDGVRRAYEADGRLLTEHALLDDDGDGEGSADPSATGQDGSLAAALFLAPAGAASVAADDSLAQALIRERASLEAEIAALRVRKDSLPAAEYDEALEALLVRLAEVSGALRAREREVPPR